MDFNLFGGTGDSGTPTSTESALYPTLTTTSDFSATGTPSFTSSSATDAASKTSLGLSATSSLVASSLRRPQPSSSTAYSASIFLSSSTFSLTVKSSTSSSSFSTTTSSTSSETSSSTSSSTSIRSSTSSSFTSSSILSSLVSSSSSSSSSKSSSSSLSVTSSSFTTLSSSALRSLRSRSHASLTSMAESSDETTTSSLTSSTTSSRSSASITSSFSAHSTTYTLGDKTITSFVTAEPTASASSSGDSGKLSSSPKIIGGVVGSVGGIIVLSALAVLFVYLRRRNRKNINPSPDFSENNSGDLNPFSEKFGLKMPFSSSKRSSGGGALAGMDDIERQVDQRANSTAQNTVGEESGDFAYRGVTNNNNLDSVFRPTATNSSGTNTAAAASRFNSISRPLGTTYEDQDGFEFSQPEQDPGFEPRLGSGAGQNEAPTNQAPPYPTGHSRGPSEDFAHFNPADYHLGEDNNDSTANARFKEDI